MKIILTVVALVLSAGPVCADIYKWVDDKGTINFTEDMGKIPPRYLQKVIIIRDSQPGGAEIREMSDAEAAAAKKVKAAEPKDANSAPNEPADKEKRVFYGGKEDKVWKADFAAIRAEIKSAEEMLNFKKNKMSKVDNLSRNEYQTIQYEIKTLTQRIADLEEKLKNLSNAAAKAGVPQDHRK